MDQYRCIKIADPCVIHEPNLYTQILLKNIKINNLYLSPKLVSIFYKILILLFMNKNYLKQLILLKFKIIMETDINVPKTKSVNFCF